MPNLCRNHVLVSHDNFETLTDFVTRANLFGFANAVKKTEVKEFQNLYCESMAPNLFKFRFDTAWKEPAEILQELANQGFGVTCYWTVEALGPYGKTEYTKM